MKTDADARAAAALSTMQHNRELLLEAYTPQRRTQFPRSATFRWLAAHLSGKAIVSTLVSAAVFRPSWLRILTAVLAARRRRR